MANVLAIDGAKLKKLLEEASGKSLKEISLEAGFSDSFLRMACKNNKATPAVTTVAKLYGIDPSAYKAPERIIEPIPVNDRAQISIDDLEVLKRSEIKELIKEALVETLNSLSWSVDPKTKTVTFLAADKEA